MSNTACRTNTSTPSSATGFQSSGRASIAVVVLSLHAPDELPDAVASLLSQDVLPEVVVVNSGGGNARGLLARRGLTVPVVEYQEILFAGAARNVGVSATQAPIVAFLASDCLAEPDWTAVRIARHRAGHTAVASAMVNSHPHNLFACAAHISNFAPRLPGLPDRDAICYGASYHRSLFERYGCFREDLRTGEDTEFHKRLTPRDKPIWAPEIRTVHRNPTTFPALMADQFRRGRHAAKAYSKIGGPSVGTVVVNGYRARVIRAHQIARRCLNGQERFLATAALGILPVSASAYVCGALVFAMRQRRSRNRAPVKTVDG